MVRSIRWYVGNIYFVIHRFSRTMDTLLHVHIFLFILHTRIYILIQDLETQIKHLNLFPRSNKILLQPHASPTLRCTEHQNPKVKSNEIYPTNKFYNINPPSTRPKQLSLTSPSSA